MFRQKGEAQGDEANSLKSEGYSVTQTCSKCPATGLCLLFPQNLISAKGFDKIVDFSQLFEGRFVLFAVLSTL